jgi:hypothetical protein
MATLNQVKYIYMAGATGLTGLPLNSLEHLWLELQGATAGLALNEKWYEVFGQTDMAWNEAAHAWLTTQGVPEEGSLNERFYYYYIGGIIPVPPPEPFFLGEGWKRTALNEWQWNGSVGDPNPVLAFGTLKPGVSYTVSGNLTQLVGTGAVDVRLGTDLTDLISLTATGNFSQTGIAGSDNVLLRFVIDDNVTLSSVILRNIRLTLNE